MAVGRDAVGLDVVGRDVVGCASVSHGHWGTALKQQGSSLQGQWS